MTLLVTMMVTSTAVVYFKSKAASVPSAGFHPESIASATDICRSTDDILAEVKRLSGDTAEAREAVNQLLLLANSAPGCRTKTIDELVLAMNKPQLDLQTDRPRFFLWRNGAAVLGELKAVEGFGFLDRSFNLNDGHFSASMSHEPAIGGITRMGAAAVPKLSDALRDKQNRDIRLAVALCLSEMGNQEAKDASKQILPTRVG